VDCLVCHKPLDPALAPEVTHPSCNDTSWLQLEDLPDPFNDVLKQQLVHMILWAEHESPRSRQVEIGPSEIGDPCDRHIGYRLANIPAINVGFDPWPAVVGTSVHGWLENAIRTYEAFHRTDDWKTETTLLVDDFIKGHADLYWAPQKTVIDWKTGGPDVMKKVRKDGPPEGYVIQAQIYGLGFVQAGWPVERVALAFLPRSGWLRDMFVWSAPFDRDAAEAALSRVYTIAQQLNDLDIFINPHRWEQVPATPSDVCGRCPWFNSLIMAEEGASNKGCPALT
jgi:hypothetical protein